MEKKKLKVSRIRRQLCSVQVLGIIIAILQVVIAAPQLKWAYDALYDNDTKKLNQTIIDFQNHNASLNLIEIPDSLQNDTIRKAQYLQRQLFLLANAVSQGDLSSDGIHNPTHVKLWMEKLKRVFAIFIKINGIETEITEWNLDSYFTGMKTVYLNPVSIAEVNTKMEVLWGKIKLLDDESNLSCKKFKTKFPMAEMIEVVRLMDSQTVSYIRLLNQYQFLLVNKLYFPDFSENKK